MERDPLHHADPTIEELPSFLGFPSASFLASLSGRLAVLPRWLPLAVRPIYRRAQRADARVLLSLRMCLDALTIEQRGAIGARPCPIMIARVTGELITLRRLTFEAFAAWRATSRGETIDLIAACNRWGRGGRSARGAAGGELPDRSRALVVFFAPALKFFTVAHPPSLQEGR
jgi:hypothetical protein